jgi:Helix-turn-helix domain
VAPKRTYTIAEASELTGLSRKALARRVERGSLRSVVRNGRRLIPRSELVRAGLVVEEREERGTERGTTDLPAVTGDSESSLVLLIRDLMERVERQANELAQFRALTVQAESLRAERELAELRARLAHLENRPAGGDRREAPTQVRRAPGGARPVGSDALWLPPGAAVRPPAASAPPRPPRTERPVPETARSPWQRWIAFVLEAAFIVLVAVSAALADLRPAVLVAVIALAWLLVAVVEVAAWRYRRPNARPQA